MSLVFNAVCISKCFNTMFCLQSKRYEVLPHTCTLGLPTWDEAIHHLSFVYGFLFLQPQPHHSTELSNLIQFNPLHDLRSSIYRRHHKILLPTLRPQKLSVQLALKNSGTPGLFYLQKKKTQQHLQATESTQESQTRWDGGILQKQSLKTEADVFTLWVTVSPSAKRAGSIIQWTGSFPPLKFWFSKV